MRADEHVNPAENSTILNHLLNYSCLCNSDHFSIILLSKIMKLQFS